MELITIRPGDIYEDCRFHPSLCLETFDGDEVSGISLIDGSGPVNCSIRHCGLIHLTPADVLRIRKDLPAHIERRRAEVASVRS